MQPISARVGNNYQIVLPEEVREVLNLHAYDTVWFLIHAGAVYMASEPASFADNRHGLHDQIRPDSAGTRPAEERDAWR